MFSVDVRKENDRLKGKMMLIDIPVRQRFQLSITTIEAHEKLTAS
jgi:hypothetical protein